METMEKHRKKRDGSLKRQLLGVLLGVVFTFLLLGRQAVFGREAEEAADKVIKVGCYPLENFHYPEDNGKVKGYETEYLERLSWITGWEIQYVIVPSWPAAMELLRKGEIDLLSPAEMTPDRLQEFLFSAQPVCAGMGGVLTRKDSDIIYEDYERFSELMIGVELGTAYADSFFQYAKNNGFEAHVHYYENHEEMMKALSEGEVDAVACNAMRLTENQRLIGKFGLTHYYFITNVENGSLMEELNYAVQQLYKTTPDIADTLLNKYYPHYFLTPFTREELLLIDSVDSLKIGCIDDIKPICFQNEEGEADGISIDILEQVSDYIGIPFEYIMIPNHGELTYEDFVKTGVDLVANVEYNSINVQNESVSLSDPYLKAEKCIVGRRGAYFEPEMHATLGIISKSESVKKVIAATYPNLKLVPYQDMEKALRALQDGAIDFLIQNQYCLERELEKTQYHDLGVIAKAGVGDYQCLATLNAETDGGKEREKLPEALLISVINKGIQSVSEQETDLLIMTAGAKMHYQYTLLDTLYINRHLLVLLAIALLMVFSLLLYSLQIHRKNIALLKENEKKLLEEKSELEKKSQTDSLTGLQNKHFFEECCNQYLKANPESCSAFVFLDLDNFKRVNDSLGHLNGDAILARVAKILKERCRTNSYLSRFGGDEFCVLMTDVSKKETEEKIKEILHAVFDTYDNEEAQVYLTTSMGCVWFQNCKTRLEKVMDIADNALYEAKSAGKNQYVIKEIKYEDVL